MCRDSSRDEWGEVTQETTGGFQAQMLGSWVGNHMCFLLQHLSRLQGSPVDFKNLFSLFSPLMRVLDVDLLAVLQMEFNPGDTDTLVLLL